MSNMVLNTLKNFFTDYKALAYFVVGLVIIFTATYALNNIDLCNSNNDLHTKLQSYNYAFIVIGLLFLLLSIGIYNKVFFIIDHIEILTTIVGSALFIAGLFFLSTAGDSSCTTSFTACAHIQWVTGLIFIMWGSIGIYGLVKGNKSKPSEDTDDKGKEEKGVDGVAYKSDSQLMAERQAKLEKLEKQYDSAIENEKMDLADKLEEKIDDLKLEIDSMKYEKELKKSKRRSAIQELHVKQEKLKGGRLPADDAKPAIGGLFGVPKI